MSEREKAFCEYFALCGDAARAAELAGCENPRTDGAGLLCREDIRKKINSLCETMIKGVQARACLAYERLALTGAADAVKLLYRENISDRELEQLNLSGIAEIKKPKEGAMEIKFFDRLKALEKLIELDKLGTKAQGSIFDAIRNGVKALEKTDDDGGA